MSISEKMFENEIELSSKHALFTKRVLDVKRELSNIGFKAADRII